MIQQLFKWPLSKTEVPIKVTDQLEKVSSQAMRAGNIIRRLREFYQNSNIDIAPTPVLPLIKEAVGFIDHEIVQSSAVIEISVTDRLVAAVDYIQIEQVIINLIRNSLEALKVSPADQRKIQIAAFQSTRGDIEVIVRDNGAGIPPEIADKLFSPFVTTRESGMGLGLVICHSIVEAHNGRLWADLQCSTGTAMHFTLPIYEQVSE